MKHFKPFLYSLLVVLAAVTTFFFYEMYRDRPQPIVLLNECIFGDAMENPKAHGAYPHPKPPGRIEEFHVTAKFKVKGKPADGVLRVEQPRPAGGWWFSAACPLVDGTFPQEIKLNPEWREVLFVLVNEKHQQVGTAKIPLKNRIIEGEIVLQ